eukprot:TRINITY_DN10910_c0_g6_i1.p1 TRINITY_DN10910_c0_g6~~TRINITY_DN10910_c0_g6_i1.p1  ORF type:complete len:964 (-),score=258.09 TRINITY_DN10910_c0_g6_i1:332-3223(-)
MTTVEIWPRGAKLTRIFLNLKSTQSPFVVLVLDGQAVGRTRPHEKGDKDPRWDDRFQVDARGSFLLFRVFVPGLLGETFCGEGSVDLQVVLRARQNPCTVQLVKDGEATGFLQFSFAHTGLAADSGPVSAGNAAGYPAGATGANAAANSAAARMRRAGTVPLPVEADERPETRQGAVGESGGAGAISEPLGRYGRPGDGAHAPAHHWQQQHQQMLPQQAAQQMHAQQQMQQQPQQQPQQQQLQHQQHQQLQQPQQQQQQPQQPQALHYPQEQYQQQQQLQQQMQQMHLGLTLASQSTSAAGSPVESGSANGSPDGGFGGSGGASPGGRLEISAAGRRNIDSLMQSTDRLQQVARRPFQHPALKGRDTMGFSEFRAATRCLLKELQVSMPGDEQIELLYNKFQGRKGGIGPEEFEALLFRLFTFMLASGEVTVSPHASDAAAAGGAAAGAAGAVAGGGAARDKRWREEFLKTNQRRDFAEVYDTGRKLGEGTFGHVHEATLIAERGQQERRVRVVKVISKRGAEKMSITFDRVREEFQVLKRLDHPHVVRIFEDFEDDLNFYLVMEPCRGGDLAEAVKNPATRDPVQWERWVATVMQQMLAAVAYCHSKGVIHKDLKPENVLMSKPRNPSSPDAVHVVVVDFGLAQMFASANERGTEVAGTPPFMAPEVWARNFSGGCDIWACGVILFYMLSGVYPFMARRIEDFPRVVAAEPNWQLVAGATAEAQNTCWRMLCKQESQRPSARALLGCRWFALHGLHVDDGAGAAGAALDPRQLEGLLRVGERSYFERFVTRLVATQLDAGEQQRVNEAFRAFDSDKDGTLSCDELRRGLLVLGASNEDAEQVVGELDVGRTGRISYTEFLAGVMDLRRRTPAERDSLLRLAWQQFLPDEQGLVRNSDVQDALAARGLAVAELPRAFLQQLRKGCSGKMTFEQFRDLFNEDDSCCIMNSMVVGSMGPSGTSRA